VGRAVSALAEAEAKASEPALAAFLAFRDWFTANDGIPLAVEASLFNREERYAGTVDHIAFLGSARNLTVVDIKTAKDIYGPEHLQTAAHAGSLAIMSDDEVLSLAKLEAFTEKRGPRLYKVPGLDMVPSVTTILDAVIAKHGLYYWYSDEAIEAVVAFVATKTLMGTEAQARDHIMRALGDRYGRRRDGKIVPPGFKKKDAAADTGSEAHMLCELWLRERVPQDAKSLLAHHPFRELGGIATCIVRIAKDINASKPFDFQHRDAMQAHKDYEAFRHARALAEWLK
jgi:hypothetical protein